LFKLEFYGFQVKKKEKTKGRVSILLRDISIFMVLRKNGF